MAGVSFRVTLRGLRQFQDRLRSLSRGMGNRAELHRRLGIQALNWVDQNFRQEGALTGAPWRKLSANTVAGRRKGSSKVLQDTGQLRMGFNMRFDNASARVGSPSEIAPHHEFGTRPYEIRPKNRTYLAFPAVSGQPLKKAFTFPSRERKFAKGTPFVFTKGPVHHPGLAQRRMLPRRTDVTFMERVRRTTLNYINELRGKGQQL